MTADICAKLLSKKRSQLLDALYELRGADEPAPREVHELVMQLLSHQDAEIRETAVIVAGIHWQLSKAYWPMLMMLAGGERDQDVLHPTSGAISALIRCGIGDIAQAGTTLAMIILDESIDPDLRGTAYVDLQVATGGIASRAHYGSLPYDISTVGYDHEWVETFLCNSQDRDKIPSASDEAKCREILPQLRSSSARNIRQGLIEVARSRVRPISKLVFEVLRLVRHTDARIRSAAIVQAGMNLRIVGGFPSLLELFVKSERDQIVLAALSSAISVLVGADVAHCQTVKAHYAKLILDQKLDIELRHAINHDLMRIVGKLPDSAPSYYVSFKDTVKSSIDPEWLRQLLDA